MPRVRKNYMKEMFCNYKCSFLAQNFDGKRAGRRQVHRASKNHEHGRRQVHGSSKSQGHMNERRTEDDRRTERARASDIGTSGTQQTVGARSEQEPGTRQTSGAQSEQEQGTRQTAGERSEREP